MIARGMAGGEPRKGPRDAETIVRELHSLLDKAGVKRPFVLAGHSAGGLFVREYAREFPADVAGVALIESSSPRQIDELPGFRASYEEDKQGAERELWEDRLRVWSGWRRLLGQCAGTPAPSAHSFPGWARRCVGECRACDGCRELSNFGPSISAPIKMMRHRG